MCKDATMSKNWKHLHLSNKALQKLITTKDSCVEVVRNKKHITLFPYHLKNVSKSIREILDEGIGKYVQNLNGILLSYKNIQLLTNIGAINNDSCFIHVDIEADFIIFQPIADRELPAIVTKKSKDHVGCLVYQTFNVSLPKPDDIEDWVGNNVSIGEEIIILITFANLDAYVPYIRGKFSNNVPERINPHPLINKKIIFSDNDEEFSSQKTKEKKRKRDCSDTEDSTRHKKIKRKSSHKGEQLSELDQGKVVNDSDEEKPASDVLGVEPIKSRYSDEDESLVVKKRKKKKRRQHTSPDGSEKNNHKIMSVKEEEESVSEFEEKPDISSMLENE